MVANETIVSVLSKRWYCERVDRNYRVLAGKIKRIKDTSVMVVGVGGVGGVLAELLVRSGFRKLIITNGSGFEPSNINRQIGATFLTSVTGLNKALVMKERLLEIDPTCNISVIQSTPEEEYDTFKRKGEEFNVSIIANCIDLPVSQLETSRLARELKAYMMIGGIIGVGVDSVIAVFKNNGIKYEDLLSNFLGSLNISEIGQKMKKHWFNRVKNSLPSIVRAKYEKGLDLEPYPVLTPLPWITAGIMCMEIIKIITGIGKPIIVPEIIVFRGDSSKVEIADLRVNPDLVKEIFPWRP
jgi:molybdopterin/thiamine biosynthesis adenylyltransferase